MARKRNPDGKMSLGGHLKELRNRLFWSAIFVFAGTIAGWFLFQPVFQILQKPVVDLANTKGVNATLNIGTVAGAFDLQLQVSIFLGVMMTSPIWLYNLWAFITPGLKKRERKFTLGFVFTAVPLFLTGCWLAWISLPGFVSTLIGFTPQGTANVINANEYILFTIRILLVFGLAFVLPVVLVMLNFANLITAKSILKSWRIAVFVIAVIAALATPTADPMSMFLVMVPLIALYFIAAAITYFNDKRRDRRLAKLHDSFENSVTGTPEAAEND
ncbi:twin-arginine translocase subunit TatC [Rhodoluna lacicola]|jgi:sec-independent protein translocase protein TatC|uniref:Sec-independent protein translocase protein TatC n=1 Tax=Rhodoluna lacicola TaxID=529884 RepID=A0A060JGG9_9MICO|nr:twin-arginine translocase subunit TatC [Rhodoluna lacicola]AIC47627.1 Twin arginine targeting (Tat) protein translocase TatC [Rhodoluna lacicola]BDS50524.1 Sec-independent protein translocase protein TatC [Rhodoluna lacicola]